MSLTPALSCAAPESHPEVLILHSYNKGYVWTDRIGEGIETVLRREFSDPHFYTEYMDTKRTSDEAYLRKFSELFMHKYRGRKMDVVITSDDHALQFMMNYGREIFPGVPVVFSGVNNYDGSVLKSGTLGSELVTGVVENVDIRSTLEAALALHPEARRIVVVNDMTEVGRTLHAQTVKAVEGLPREVRLDFLEDLEMGEVVEKVRNLGRDSIVLFLVFFRDRAGRKFSHDESFRLVRSAASAPIYTCWDIYNGLGVTGGMMTTGYGQGEAAANMAVKILRGLRPGTVPVEKSPNRFMFDFRELERFGIPQGRLPAGSEIFNRPSSFYQENRGKVLGVTMLFLLLCGMIGALVLNIRKRRAVEAELMMKAGLLDVANDAILLVDGRGMLRYFNQALIGMTGYTDGELMARGLHGIEPPEYATRIQANIDMIMREGQAVFESAYLRKDGKVLPLEVHSRLIETKGEKICLSLVRDITERKRLEDALRESEHRLRTIIDAAPQCIQLVSEEGTLLEINPAGVSMLEADSAEVLRGKTVYSLAAPEYREALRALTVKAFRGEPGALEFEGIGLKGARRWFSTRTVPLKNAKGEVIARLGITDDVTEHRKLEAQLLQSRKMEAIGQLAGGIAHDFNNILTVILGYGETLKADFAGQEHAARALDMMVASAEKAASLTQSLLAFSRKQPIVLRAVNINDVIRDMEKFLRRVIGEDIELRTKFPERPLMVMADKSQMEQVLMNLCANARDAMPGGGLLTIETSVAVLSDERAPLRFFETGREYAILRISDTGSGMDESTREKMFEPFFTTKAPGKGTGLGLSAVYGIVTQHNGDIQVASEPGKGTAFSVCLPLLRPETREETRYERPPAPRGCEKILVAEDDADVRDLIRTILETHGYAVIEAGNGEEAVQVFQSRSEEIEMAVLDVIMPRMNGKEAYEKLRELRPDLSVLFISGYTFDVLAKERILDPGLEYLAKPVSSYELLKKTRDILDGRCQSQEKPF